MKKIILSLISVAVSFSLLAQTAWVEPVPTIATEKITIYVDLSKLDQSLDHNKLLLENPGPMYIWTWKPVELAASSPNVNGTGEKPWQNSNDALMMTAVPDKGPKVWKFEMVPTEFYGATAAQVYASGLAFLVKPKNGGGYGDPDIKSNDLTIAIEPPKTDKGSLYPFPTMVLPSQITTFVYDNTKELKPTMLNLPVNTTMYLHLKAIAKDTASGVFTTYEPYTLFQALTRPELIMRSDGAGKWTLSIILEDFFANIPPTSVITELELRALKSGWSSDDDTGGNFDKVPKPKVGCN